MLRYIVACYFDFTNILLVIVVNIVIVIRHSHFIVAILLYIVSISLCLLNCYDAIQRSYNQKTTGTATNESDHLPNSKWSLIK